MTTYERICIKDYEVSDGENKLNLIRGEKYITTPVSGHGQVVVFSNYWGLVPVDIFAGEILFTGEKV